MAEFDIFISYRRDGGFETAKHLYDLLRNDGYAVSFDIDTLREGDFDTALLTRIEECEDFILIVDQHCFERTLNPNFDSKNDWLRQELAYALKLQKNIIPIRLAGAIFPNNLPEDIKSLPKKNDPIYSRDYFDAFYKKLKSFIHSRPKKLGSDVTHPGAEIHEVHLRSDVACDILHFEKIICSLNPNESTTIRVSYGKHSFTFVSKENPDIKKEFLIAVNADNNSEYLDNKMSDVLEKSAEQEKLAALDHVVLKPINQQGKYGFINEDGNVVIPFEYDNASDFEEGLARVFLNGHWGYINKLNRMVIPTEYDFPAFPFHNGLAIVGKNDGVGFIDKENHVIIPFDYLIAKDFSDGLAAVMNKQWKWGYINKRNEVVIPFRYDYAESFFKGFALVGVRSDYSSDFDDQYYIDKTGAPHPEKKHLTKE